jgi:hypothetical protein
MRSRLPRSGAALAGALVLALGAGGCAREAPDVREVRTATRDYLRVLQHRDMKGIADRSTCLVSTNSLVGGNVLAIEPLSWVRMGDLDSLVRDGMLAQRRADSLWAFAKDSTADSLFGLARTLSNRASVYRNALRAVPLSAPGALVSRDSLLEVRSVRARFRYAGPVIGPRPVDREETIHLLRAPGGKWIVFSVYLREEDPLPDLGRPRRV